MKIEEEIFRSYLLDKNKIIKYGFNKVEEHYEKNYSLHNDEFTLTVFIYDKEVNGVIIDNNFKDEYKLFRMDNVSGEFVASIREEFEKILIEIRNNCFVQVYFPDPQAVRIGEYLQNKYQAIMDRPWDVFPLYTIYRLKNNNRWLGLIMDVKANKLAPDVGPRFVLNIKPPKERMESLLKEEYIYPGYHMSKKSWISISLEDYYPDEYIYSLIDESYKEIVGLSKIKLFPNKKK